MNAPPRVVLSRSGVLQLRKGHPWIHRDHVAEVAARDGDVVQVEGPAGSVRGVGVWNGASHLALRMASLGSGVDPSPDFWRARLDRAVARRQRDEVAAGDEVCRWVHAEADGLPGLIIDRLGCVAVLQAGCLWADRVASEVAHQLVDQGLVTGVLARHDGAFRRPEGLVEGVEVLAGEVPDEVEVSWAGLRRTVSPRGGQKTGAYVDQRLNHAWAATRLAPGRVLDLFCNEGGFALPVAARGSTVDAVDGSAAALERLSRNAERNGLGDRVVPHKANVFDHLRALEQSGTRYDGVVLDPPALAKRRSDLRGAERGYRDLNLRALRCVRDGGRLITCSCSHHVDAAAFRRLVAQAAAASGRHVELLEERGAAPCHPRLLTFPESDYLSVLLLEVRDTV